MPSPTSRSTTPRTTPPGRNPRPLSTCDRSRSRMPAPLRPDVVRGGAAFLLVASLVAPSPVGGKTNRRPPVNGTNQTCLLRTVPRCRVLTTRLRLGGPIPGGARALLEAVRSTEASKLLVDAQNMTAHDKGDQRWLGNEWMPKVSRPGSGTPSRSTR
jgi:hypothetical protein